MKSYKADLKMEFATTSHLTQTLSPLRTDITCDIFAQVSNIVNMLSHTKNLLQSVCSFSIVQDLPAASMFFQLSNLPLAQ